MSTRVNAVQHQCDWCGTLSEERPLASSGVIVETPLPEGWTGIGYGSARNESRHIILKNPYGSQISHLCPICSARPAGDMITHLGHFQEQEQSA